MDILDKYYKRPVFYDYLLSIVVTSAIVLINYKYDLYRVNVLRSEGIAADLGAIGLTVSGFILTLSTILISLKTSQILNKNKLSNKNTPFEIFLASPLYSKSIEILKNAVLSLVITSIVLYIYKAVVPDKYMEYIFYFNMNSILIILTTFLRCFHVINLILQMQSSDNQQ